MATFNVLAKHLGTKSETTTTTSTSKKKLNESVLKKWAIVSPLVGSEQLVIVIKTFTQIHIADSISSYRHQCLLLELKLHLQL